MSRKDKIIGSMSLTKAQAILNDKPNKRVELFGYKIFFFTDIMYLLQENGFKCNKCKVLGNSFILISPAKTRHAYPYLRTDNTNITNDHIKPRSIGGANCIHNYQPMCSDCNNYKGDKWSIFDRLFYINNCIKYHFKWGRLTDRCECKGLLKEAFTEVIRIVKSYFLLDLIDPRYYKDIPRGRYNNGQRESSN